MTRQNLDIDLDEFDLPELPAPDGRACLLQWADSFWVRPNLGTKPGIIVSLMLDCAAPGLPIGLCAPLPLKTAEAHIRQLQWLISACRDQANQSWLDRSKREGRQ